MAETDKQDLIIQLSDLHVAEAEPVIFALQAPGARVVLEGVEQEEQDLRDLQGFLAGRDEGLLQ